MGLLGGALVDSEPAPDENEASADLFGLAEEPLLRFADRRAWVAAFDVWVAGGRSCPPDPP